MQVYKIFQGLRSTQALQSNDSLVLLLEKQLTVFKPLIRALSLSIACSEKSR